MFNQLMIAKNHVQSFIQDKKGAVAFEYVLIIGGVSVVVVGLLALAAATFMPAVIDGVCAAISSNTAVGISIPAGACTP